MRGRGTRVWFGGDHMVIIGWFFGGNFLVLSASTANGDVPKGASFGPIPSACFTEIPGLGEAVVVVVAKFSVGGVTPGAFQSLVMLGPKPPLY